MLSYSVSLQKQLNTPDSLTSMKFASDIYKYWIAICMPKIISQYCQPAFCYWCCVVCMNRHCFDTKKNCHFIYIKKPYLLALKWIQLCYPSWFSALLYTIEIWLQIRSGFLTWFTITQLLLFAEWTVQSRIRTQKHNMLCHWTMKHK